jgi:energy-coupling factor transporter ATP-binding protein EcfA2
LGPRKFLAANEPSLLLLDEPTGDLDSENTANIVNLLYELNASKRKSSLKLRSKFFLGILASYCSLLAFGLANSFNFSSLDHALDVTFVMVTHDVYLKNFAHRVLWLRDGRLAKEELIPESTRQAALAELRSKQKTVLFRCKFSSAVYWSLCVIDFGIFARQNLPKSSDAGSKISSNKTEVRRPEDYEVLGV